MTKIHASIKGIGGYVPEYVLTNDRLSKMVDTSDEWITSRTGIKERRILNGDGRATSDLGYEAVKNLLEKTGTNPDDIELVICATVTADTQVPDTANTICYKAGINNAWAFDINAACSGFLFALTTGAQFIESGRYKKVIVVGADMMSAVTDYTDRTTCILFGDGGGAVLLEPDTEGYGVIDSVLKGDGVGRNLLYIKNGGSAYQMNENSIANREHFIYQDGKPVFKAAVNGMSSAINELMTRNNLTKEDLSWLVPHQANKRIINAISESLDFPMERVMTNIERYGNTTAATIPLCLWDYEKQIKKGDKLILTAFGGGFTWGATYLKWGY